jgi:hypothetical protein
MTNRDKDTTGVWGNQSLPYDAFFESKVRLEDHHLAKFDVNLVTFAIYMIMSGAVDNMLNSDQKATKR